MRHYTQLTQEQRYQIYALLKMDHSQVEIVKVISVHKSTISRELRRNRGLRGYRPKQAHRLAVNDPIPRPDFLGDLVKPIHLPQRIPKLGSKEDGEGFHREKESFSVGKPGSSIVRQTTTRDQEMNVGKTARNA